MGFDVRLVIACAAAASALSFAACAPVQFGASNFSSIAKPEDAANDPSRDISIQIPNYRVCREHDVDIPQLYSPEASSSVHADILYAFINVPKDLSLGDQEIEDFSDSLQRADREGNDPVIEATNIVGIIQKTSFSSGAPRFAELEKQIMSIHVDKAAYGKLLDQASKSLSSHVPLKTLFLAFADVNGDGKFSPETDIIISSSEGLPVNGSAQKAMKASIASKGTPEASNFSDVGSSAELKYQARTHLLMADEKSCSDIADPEYRQICEQSCDMLDDPLVIDFSGTGFHATSVADGVSFDLDGSGVLEKTAWVAPSSQQFFLAIDSNQNGRIDDGRELFGTAPLAGSSFLPTNGFESLKSLDSNFDGVIDARDKAYKDLVLWNGVVSSGKNQSSKLLKLSSLVESISLNYVVKNQKDAHGNKIYAKAIARLTNGQTREIADIWFTH